MPTLALIDGHSIAYRAFFALPEDLATTSGQVTNAVYGFTRMLIKLLGDHSPEGLVVAWDVGRQTFRSERYPEYKAQRTAAPDTFKSQLPLMREVLDALGIRQVQLEGFEADDVIASLSERAIEAGWDVLIVTGDRDAFQLIGDHRKILYTRRGITDTVIADDEYVDGPVRHRAAACTYSVPLSAATRPTTCPALPGVGDKTAAKLLNQYGSLEGIFEHLDEATPKLRENLAASQDQVLLNRELMTLVRDLELDVGPGDFRRQEWDHRLAKDLFVSLEFHSLWDDLVAVQPEADMAAPAEPIDAEGRMASGNDVAARAGVRLVLDVVDEGDVSGLVVLEDAGVASIVPFDRLGRLAEVLTDPGVEKVAHHAKPLVRTLLDHGVSMRGLGFDTALAAYIVNPASRTYPLGEIALRYAGIELESPDSEAAASRRPGHARLLRRARPGCRRPPCRGRSIECPGRSNRSWSIADELDLYRRFELPLVRVLARMEAAGHPRRPCLSGSDGHRDAQRAREPRSSRSTNWPVSRSTSTAPTSSPRSCTRSSSCRSSRRPPAASRPRTPRCSRSSTIRWWSSCSGIGRSRSCRGTYVDGYLPLIGCRRENPHHLQPDGGNHRPSVLRGAEPPEHPGAVGVRALDPSGVRRRTPDSVFVVADYSQIELRVMAHLSEDPGLVEAFAQGLDIHTATAARVFGVEPELVSAEMRRMAKVINFGLLYGMEAFGLAQRLGSSRDEAKAHMEAYFSQFPDVKAFLDGVVTDARRMGYTSTLFGRRRYLPELKSDNFRIRQMGERMALNAPIQGTAADIIKKAMIDLEPALADDARMLLQIHDELIVECPAGSVDAVERTIEAVMQEVVELRVPLVVDVAHGDTLDAVKG